MKRVKVYYNLHKKCWSVCSMEREDYGKLIAHETEVLLANATYIVRQAGRKRVIKEQRKNVHAFVVGYWTPMVVRKDLNKEIKSVYYNPYTVKNFIINYHQRIDSSEYAHLTESRELYAVGSINI